MYRVRWNRATSSWKKCIALCWYYLLICIWWFAMRTTQLDFVHRRITSVFETYNSIIANVLLQLLHSVNTLNLFARLTGKVETSMCLILHSALVTENCDNVNYFRVTRQILQSYVHRYYDCSARYHKSHTVVISSRNQLILELLIEPTHFPLICRAEKFEDVWWSATAIEFWASSNVIFNRKRHPNWRYTHSNWKCIALRHSGLLHAHKNIRRLIWFGNLV